MSADSKVILSACGQEVGPDEIHHAQEVVRMCAGLSRTELALTLCEHWGWVGVTGKAPLRACQKVLEKLEQEGLLQLPAKQKPGPGSVRSSSPEVASSRTSPGPLVESELESVRPVRLERVDGREATSLFNAYVERYHPLGYKRPFGCTLRYYITSPRGQLGCVLLSGAARALRCRDEWIGWSAKQRLANLPLVVNNSRYLLFPWVRVPHLASHVLGLLARQVRDDWEILGKTTGEGLRLRGHSYRTSQKLILICPLVRDFRARLQCDPQPRSCQP